MGKTVYTADMGQPPMDPEVAPPDQPASAPKGKQPADRSVFTQEDLKQFGGKMKSPPRDVMPEDLKKKPKKFADGGVTKNKDTIDKMRQKEKELENENTFALDFIQKGRSPILDKLLDRSYRGTSLGPGAVAAGKEASKKEWEKGKSLREMEPIVRQQMREAALEEQRETARMGLKKGGKVKAYAKGGSVRGDGCAQRGKTKGRFI